VIRIPENTLVVLCGPAGCGKSFFAARHFLPTQVVSSDHCRALISDDPANQSVSHHAFDLMRFIIRKRLLLGRLTVADATHLSRDSRSALIRLGRLYGFKLAAIVFNIPLEVCLERNLKRERVVPEDAIIRQHANLQVALSQIPHEGFDYLFVLDLESQSSASIQIVPPA
jgi:protein phosphatase